MAAFLDRLSTIIRQRKKRRALYDFSLSANDWDIGTALRAALYKRVRAPPPHIQNYAIYYIYTKIRYNNIYRVIINFIIYIF